MDIIDLHQRHMLSMRYYVRHPQKAPNTFGESHRLGRSRARQSRLLSTTSMSIRCNRLRSQLFMMPLTIYRWFQIIDYLPKTDRSNYCSTTSYNSGCEVLLSLCHLLKTLHRNPTESTEGEQKNEIEGCRTILKPRAASRPFYSGFFGLPFLS